VQLDSVSKMINNELKEQDGKLEFLLKNHEQTEHNAKRTNKQMEIMKKRRFRFSVCQKFVFTFTTMIMALIFVVFFFIH
jgi:cell division protein FtsL